LRNKCLVVNEGRRQKAEGRRQEADGTLFVTGIYTPLQRLFALKGEVLDMIILIINQESIIIRRIG
jgi:hypothetical protein